LIGLIGGEEEQGQAHVVALLASESVRCTGTLIAPHVVATAAHCVAPPPEHVGFGLDPIGSGWRASVASSRTHPQYDPTSLDRDLAVVFLEEAAPVEPVPFTDALGTWFIGRDLLLVGFGSAIKRSGMGRAGDLRERSFTVLPDSASSCFGDSGGPALFEGTLAGVLSSGDSSCERFARFGRIDAAFFEEAMALAAKEHGDPGEPCARNGNCASGFCLHLEDHGRCATSCDTCDQNGVCLEGGCIPALSLPVEIRGGCSTSGAHPDPALWLIVLLSRAAASAFARPYLRDRRAARRERCRHPQTR
jgi:hypothetical protein